MQPLAVVGPYDMNVCFEAMDALARAGEGDESIRVEKAAHFADPGVTHCWKCEAILFREGEVIMCSCGEFTHEPTGNGLTHDQVWQINHRPPKQRR